MYSHKRHFAAAIMVIVLGWTVSARGQLCPPLGCTLAGDDARLIYNAANGEITVDASHVSGGVGLFGAQSATGIFTGVSPVFPPNEAITIDLDREIGWFAMRGNEFMKPFNLGAVAQPGLSAQYLFSDLTVFYSLGFGLENSQLELVCFNCLIGDAEPPMGVHAAQTVHLGDTAVHMFAALAEFPQSLHWSELELNASPTPPAIAATLGTDGAFSWNTTGSAFGKYFWSATVTDGFGLTDTATLAISVVPEPASALLLGLAASYGVLLHQRIRNSCFVNA